ncbi:MAG: iron-sulfur cluster carrier protein ApbC [Alcanivoracaceae bacterium]|uniref:iron-sulfur cluster carrier protein ApbC n=1 Tax=Alcanivorax sp. MD8A TaxID=1177157 RepID=UPI000C6167BF|nr:iron-sulfur cluster carrier protein ApbC [Alcanivorax sp. MD8A]MAX54091.1 iron-sulfur cluster carrier protein ApbC [Alcanivoracaceae bacterium]MCG8439608.1 iron-sulfur cluster carrier protein ApbC [Pseudomonadales bacterium]MED5431016.1 iron-sulfur cluster carrier protein ApbC [Pseudomonadota bacterium]MEE2871269.1 iron-sulfur cluster carrier protein ApbC [Pseudomonadota bacterium]PNE02892.1 ATP-binding Mrp/Nbp35 family protein [Alcanivorax sp. MD8A]|tara:strand:- start:8259 stop:9344 length:1086 start_codon:yes stop_codon:yes gene_type:complete
MHSAEQRIRQQLGHFIPEDLGVSLESIGAVSNVSVSESQVSAEVVLGYPLEGVRASLEAAIGEHLADALEGRALSLSLRSQIVPHRAQSSLPALDQVANVIAVASGKGGVGKSTTAVNLALALQAEGARVGLLDADVFGPSQPLMLGKPDGTRPEVLDGKVFVPVEAYGLQTMSMGYLTTKQTPVVWRGPKASGALVQMMEQTRWKQLDYLLVDLPPGTGDIQLTLAQKIPVAGAVVITTPQDIALLDAIKGVEMFRKVDIRVLGIVENMAVHICSHCGHQEHVFGQGGGQRMAQDYDTEVLAALPLSLRIREQADSGEPVVAACPDSEEAGLYRQAARRMAARLSLTSKGKRAFPKVTQH